MYDGDVLVALLDAGLVYADQPHAAHVVKFPGLTYKVLDASPQSLGRGSHVVGRMGHRQLFAQRQCQRLKQQREAAAFACPRYFDLRRLATSGATHTRHAGVQPGFKLEEVQVPPFLVDAVMDALIDNTTMRAGQFSGVAHQVKVDPMLYRVQLDLGHLPRSLQAQGRCKHRFNANAHFKLSAAAVSMPQFWCSGASVMRSSSTHKGIEPNFPYPQQR